jgi:hypothetical protein
MRKKQEAVEVMLHATLSDRDRRSGVANLEAVPAIETGLEAAQTVIIMSLN